MSTLTAEQYKEASLNGVSRATLYKRVIKMNWDVRRAITETPKKKLSDRNTKESVFTRKQLREADEKGISRATLYSRVKKGMTAEEALSIPIREKKEHDWENEVYIMYKFDSFIANGTVFEIAEWTKKDIRDIKRYATDYYKRVVGDNGIVLELVSTDGDEYY